MHFMLISSIAFSHLRGLVFFDGNSHFAKAPNTVEEGVGPVEEEDELVERKLGLVEQRVRSRGSGRVSRGAKIR